VEDQIHKSIFFVAQTTFLVSRKRYRLISKKLQFDQSLGCLYCNKQVFKWWIYESAKLRIGSFMLQWIIEFGMASIAELKCLGDSLFPKWLHRSKHFMELHSKLCLNCLFQQNYLVVEARIIILFAHNWRKGQTRLSPSKTSFATYLKRIFME